MWSQLETQNFAAPLALCKQGGCVPAVVAATLRLPVSVAAEPPGMVLPPRKAHLRHALLLTAFPTDPAVEILLYNSPKLRLRAQPDPAQRRG